MSYDYQTPEDCGYIHETDLPNFDDMRDYLEGIVEVVYTDGDIKKLDHCIEELCCLLNVEFRGGEPVLTKKEKKDECSN